MNHTEKSKDLQARCSSPFPTVCNPAFEELRALMESRLRWSYSNDPLAHLFLEESVNSALATIYGNLHSRQAGGEADDSDDPGLFIPSCMRAARRQAREFRGKLTRLRDVPTDLVDSLDEPIDHGEDLALLDQVEGGGQYTPEYELSFVQVVDVCHEAMSAVSDLSRKVLVLGGFLEFEDEKIAGRLEVVRDTIQRHRWHNRVTLRDKRPDLIAWLGELGRWNRGGRRP